MKLPQLSLRELFWLVLVCALACAWWLSHRALVQSRRDAARFEKNASEYERIAEKLRDAIDGMGGKAIYWYDEHADDFGVTVVPPLPPAELGP
jgi:hypothetical protein